MEMHALSLGHCLWGRYPFLWHPGNGFLHATVCFQVPALPRGIREPTTCPGSPACTLSRHRSTQGLSRRRRHRHRRTHLSHSPCRLHLVVPLDEGNHRGPGAACGVRAALGQATPGGGGAGAACAQGPRPSGARQANGDCNGPGAPHRVPYAAGVAASSCGTAGSSAANLQASGRFLRSMHLLSVLCVLCPSRGVCDLVCCTLSSFD